MIKSYKLKTPENVYYFKTAYIHDEKFICQCIYMNAGCVNFDENFKITNEMITSGELIEISDAQWNEVYAFYKIIK